MDDSDKLWSWSDAKKLPSIDPYRIEWSKDGDVLGQAPKILRLDKTIMPDHLFTRLDSGDFTVLRCLARVLGEAFAQWFQSAIPDSSDPRAPLTRLRSRPTKVRVHRVLGELWLDRRHVRAPLERMFAPGEFFRALQGLLKRVDRVEAVPTPRPPKKFSTLWLEQKGRDVHREQEIMLEAPAVASAIRQIPERVAAMNRLAIGAGALSNEAVTELLGKTADNRLPRGSGELEPFFSPMLLDAKLAMWILYSYTDNSEREVATFLHARGYKNQHGHQWQAGGVRNHAADLDLIIYGSGASTLRRLCAIAPVHVPDDMLRVLRKVANAELADVELRKFFTQQTMNVRLASWLLLARNEAAEVCAFLEAQEYVHPNGAPYCAEALRAFSEDLQRRLHGP